MVLFVVSLISLLVTLKTVLPVPVIVIFSPGKNPCALDVVAVAFFPEIAIWVIETVRVASELRLAPNVHPEDVHS